MISWRDRGRGGNSLDGVGTTSTSVGDVSLPLGPGEWQEPLGLPLCVVCQNVRYIWFPKYPIHVTNTTHSPIVLKLWRKKEDGKKRTSTSFCNFCEPSY